jgi:hypothetical protein
MVYQTAGSPREGSSINRLFLLGTIGSSFKEYLEQQGIAALQRAAHAVGRELTIELR